MLTCAASLTQIHRYMDHPRYETFKQGFANTKLIKLLLIIPRGLPAAEASFHRVSSLVFAYCVILTILQISFAEMSNGVTLSLSRYLLSNVPQSLLARYSGDAPSPTPPPIPDY